MGRSRRAAAGAWILPVVLLVAGLGAPPPAGAQTTRLVLSKAPSGPASPQLPLPIRTRDTAGTIHAYLREASGIAVPGIVLYAAPVAGLSVTLARPGGAAPASALTLDLPSAASLDISVTATWDDYGAAEVPLLARSDSDVSTIAVLRVARPGGPPLTVVGATPTGLTIASSGPALTTGITVATGDHPAAGVRATVSKLVSSASGVSYSVEQPEVSIGDMEADSTVFVPLDAGLPYAGPFTGTLRLEHDGIADPPVALTVTRTLGASGASIVTVQTSSSAFDRWAPFVHDGRMQATRTAVLRESAGNKAELNSPMFLKPSARVGEATIGDVAARVVGTELSPTSQAGCGVSETDGITVEGGHDCRVEITLELPAEAGQIDGTLAFAQPGYTPLEAPLTVQLRRGLITAVVCLLIGLFLGWLINHYLKSYRTRLLRLARVGRIGQELVARVAALPGGLVDDGERTIYDLLRKRLQAVATDASGGVLGDAELDANLDAAAALVPLFVPWVVLRRAVRASSHAPADLRDEVEAIGRDLAAPETTKDDAGPLRERLVEAEKRLRSVHVGAVRNEIERTRREVEKWFSAEELADISAQLEAALARIATEEGSPEEARRELLVAQALAARGMSARIDELLDAPAPVGMDDDAWRTLRIEVRATLAGLGAKTPEAALQAVREADYRLIRGLVDAVYEKVRADRAALAGSKSPDEQKRAAALDEILAKLDEVRAALRRGDLAGAHATYDAVRPRLAEAKAAGFLGLAEAAGEVAELPPVFSSAAPLTAMTDVPATTVVPLPDPAAVARKWRRYEWLVFGASLVVGVLVGLLALYSGKPTWGSEFDVLTAVLWGAGLWPVSGAIAQGFPGVRTALTG